MPRLLLIDNGSKIIDQIINWFEQYEIQVECATFIPPNNPISKEKNIEIHGTYWGPNYQLEENHYNAVILSGSSCFNPLMEWFPVPSYGFWPFFNLHRVPILGICYGHQLIAQQFGGNIIKEGRYEEKKLKRFHRSQRDSLFEGLPDVFDVSMFHECSVVSTPPHFACLGTTIDGMVGAMVYHNSENWTPIYGVQFHPESVLTPGLRDQIFENFWQFTALGGEL